MYIEEHTSCQNYRSGKAAGFQCHLLKKGENLHIHPNNDKNYILFSIEGKGNVTYDFQSGFDMEENQMVFLPKLTGLEYIALNDSLLVTSEFDRLFNLCDKMALQSLEAYYNPQNSNTDWRLDIKKPLKSFLDLLIVYLQSGASCKHLHEIKLKEFFMLMRAFYSKKENAAFFSPIINKNIEFKTLVINQYPKAKTVQELAKLCDFSLATFNRIFTETFQEAPYQWMQKQRAKLLAIQLSNKEIPLNAIINEFHFSSPAHLTIFCKKHFMMTPSKFRSMSKAERQKKIDKVFNNQSKGTNKK